MNEQNNKDQINDQIPKVKSHAFQFSLIFTIWFAVSGLLFYFGIQLVQPENKTSSISLKNKNLESEKNIESDSLPENDEMINSTEFDSGTSRLRASTWFSDFDAMKKNVQFYDEIHPFIYGIEGKLTNTGRVVSSWGETQTKERVAILRSINPNVKIIPTIFRWENKGEKIQEVIGMGNRPDIRDLHIQNILNIVEKYNFDGIDIDYEGMDCHKKSNFEEFIKILSTKLKQKNKLLSVSVHPKTPSKVKIYKYCAGLKKKIEMDFNENWRGPQSHDYKILSQYADRVKIMAYELHPRKYRNPGPGPQAPNSWIKEIIRYALKNVSSKKLYMAIPTYGYDWGLNCSARIKSVYYSGAVSRLKLGNHFQPTNIDSIIAQNKNSKSWSNLNKYRYVHENKTYEDPSIWYKSDGCDHVAFYMNKKAFKNKMDLLRSYDLGGFSFWQLISDNDPGINDYLQLLIENKLPPVEKFKETEIKKEVSKKEVVISKF